MLAVHYKAFINCLINMHKSLTGGLKQFIHGLEIFIQVVF